MMKLDISLADRSLDLAIPGGWRARHRGLLWCAIDKKALNKFPATGGEFLTSASGGSAVNWQIALSEICSLQLQPKDVISVDSVHNLTGFGLVTHRREFSVQGELDEIIDAYSGSLHPLTTPVFHWGCYMCLLKPLIMASRILVISNAVVVRSGPNLGFWGSTQHYFGGPYATLLFWRPYRRPTKQYCI